MKNHPNRNKIRDWPNYLKQFRIKHGLTQKLLANKLQISLRNLENWEQGESIPPAYLKKALNDIESDL
jgi:DNA-binding transcriptional regulator YiaG